MANEDESDDSQCAENAGYRWQPPIQALVQAYPLKKSSLLT
jgi:hypothetical protein